MTEPKTVLVRHMGTGKIVRAEVLPIELRGGRIGVKFDDETVAAYHEWEIIQEKGSEDVSEG